MKRNLILYILIFAVCILTVGTALTSCGRRGDEVSVFYYTYSDTYISGVRSAMDAGLRRAGVGYHNYDAGSNQTTQTEQVDTAIAKGTTMLIVNIVDTGSDDAARTIVEKARAADIPLIFFNRSVSEEIVKSYDKCIFIGTDYEAAGHMQGEMIAENILANYDKYDINGDGKISYVLFKGQQGNAEAEARTKYSVEDCNALLSEAGRPELMFYDKNNKNGYIVDQDGNWSNAAANNSMKTILSGYSEAGGNMVELVIANSDEMALGAIAALAEAGYNKEGGRVIPVFGVDATEGAVAKIRDGFMTGTVKQDGVGMAEAIVKVTENILGDMEALSGIDEAMVIGGWRINIPYSLYTGDDAE
ncbi:MAG: galactose ABC transporter substrate-binding protein [Clostridia bacterium]|nr:galactose ABC transporter substrate-binding protein [Clostridia bacterium]